MKKAEKPKVTKKILYFAVFGEFDKKKFYFLLLLMNSTKKILYFAAFGEFDEKKFYFSLLLMNSTKKILYFVRLAENMSIF